jgi:hypothetical protein
VGGAVNDVGAGFNDQLRRGPETDIWLHGAFADAKWERRDIDQTGDLRVDARLDGNSS